MTFGETYPWVNLVFIAVTVVIGALIFVRAFTKRTS